MLRKCKRETIETYDNQGKRKLWDKLTGELVAESVPVFTNALFDGSIASSLCGMISNGISLSHAVKSLNVPRWVVTSWLHNHSDFREAFMAAKAQRALWTHEELFENEIKPLSEVSITNETDNEEIIRWEKKTKAIQKKQAVLALHNTIDAPSVFGSHPDVGGTNVTFNCVVDEEVLKKLSQKFTPKLKADDTIVVVQEKENGEERLTLPSADR